MDLGLPNGQFAVPEAAPLHEQWGHRGGGPALLYLSQYGDGLLNKRITQMHWPGNI